MNGLPVLLWLNNLEWGPVLQPKRGDNGRHPESRGQQALGTTTRWRPLIIVGKICVYSSIQRESSQR